jgi:peroxiredoxin
METNIKLFNNDLLFREDGDTIMKTMEDLFFNKRVIMFGLPGAFTPTCSGKQLPAYEDMYNLFMDTQKVDAIYCLSVNDMFVMDAWGKDLGIKNIKLLPDGDGALTRQLGMLVDKPTSNFGMRSWRHSSFIINGIVKKMFVEPGINNLDDNGDPYEVSDPQTMLDYVKSL